MSPLDVLRGARELLSDPARWTKGVNARDAAGERVGILSVDAACWCMWGALDKVRGTSGWDDAVEALRAAVGGAPVSCWNDAPARTHAEVLAAFDRAIASLEAQS